MKTQFKFFGAVALGSLLAVGAANAATLVTFNSAGNAIDTSATKTVFQATGASGFIFSTFSIASSSGSGVSFSETGTFSVGAFGVAPTAGNPSGAVTSNVTVGYDVFADIVFNGVGAWTGNDFSATAGLFQLNLRAVNKAAPGVDIALGTASLSPGPDTIATVKLLGSNNAQTTLSGTFAFTPAAGTTGVGNFFQAPIPFNIGFSVGNFGGNAANTTYSVGAGGAIQVFTPGPGLPAATGNLTFVGVVPEPGMISLVGLALVGAAVAGRRKAVKA